MKIDIGAAQLRNRLLLAGRYGKTIFLVTVAAVVGFFLYVSNGLIKDLATQERERMQIWADATREIIKITSADDAAEQAIDTDIEFLLSIISRNTTIPVLLTDGEGNILQWRNFTLPDPSLDEFGMPAMTPQNEDFLQKKLATLSQTDRVIHISISPGLDYPLYYEDSTLLKRLSYFPYIQLIVMLAFIAVVYFAVLSTKKAEQNKVWVGLSKETAHQLGTPISSLMAWIELLPDMGVDSETVGEMDKDVKRLSTIASRFSKIGSEPNMEAADLRDIVGNACRYMSTRVSPKVNFSRRMHSQQLPVKACAPLFEWVMENLIKNAVDAMEGHGQLSVEVSSEKGMGIIDVTDTGKGILRKNFKHVFNPGFTTKKRGWGLGLTLAKRIIEQYHRGRIYVKSSVPGQGTTFRIEVPLIQAT